MFKAKVNEIPDKSPKGTLNSGSDDNFVQIDVPGDGSCLFWSVAYAYLTLAEDDNDFHKRYKCLFEDKGIEHSKSFREQIFNKVLTSKEIIGFDEALVGKFRDKVAGHISSNTQFKEAINANNIFCLFEGNENQRKLVCQKFERNLDIIPKSESIEDRENEIKSEFNKRGSEVDNFVFQVYLECVCECGFWGGETEIEAMSQMLKVRIDISKDGNSLPPYGRSFSTKIQLYHVNGGTHYNFGLEKSIIDNYIRDTPKKSSPLKDIGNSPRWQDSTSHSKSPGKENISSHEKPRSSQTSAKRKISFSKYDNHPSKKVKVSHLIEGLSEGCVPSGLTHSFHGSIYQVKLSMLFLKRGLDKGYTFRLYKELDRAQSFDDLVFAYIDSSEKASCRFLQAKHTKDADKKITLGDLFSVDKKGNFNLRKYFVSYLKIKKEENFKNLNLEDFIICTNMGFDLDESVQGQVRGLKKTNSGKNKGKKVSVEEINTEDDIFSTGTGVRYKIKCSSKLISHFMQDAEVKKEIPGQPEDAKKQIKEFFEKLVFAVGQLNQEMLGKMLEHEISSSLCKKFNYIGNLSEDAYNKFQIQIIDWMMSKEGKSFSKEEIRGIFQEIEQEIDTISEIRGILTRIEEKQDRLLAPKEDMQVKKLILPERIQYNMKSPVKPFAERSELKILHKKLMGSKEKVISRLGVISGLGGVGKSELARKYACEYEEDYSGRVIWIDSETQESIERSFRGLAKELKDLEKEEGEDDNREDIKTLVKGVYECFRKTRSLFVFDNAESYEDIEKFLPSYHSIGCNDRPFILITSREGDWKKSESDTIEEVKLGMLKEAEAVKFIRESLSIKGGQEDDIKRLADALNYFPLTLRQAISFLRCEKEKLQKRTSKEFQIRKYLSSHKQVGIDMGPFWDITFQKISKQGGVGIRALDILNIMAYLNYDDVPAKVFLKSPNDENELWYSLDLLHRYSMIDLQKGKASIHKLVRETIRSELRSKEKEEDVLRQALELMVRVTIANKEGDDFVAPLWSHIVQHSKLKKYFLSSSNSSGSNVPSGSDECSSSDQFSSPDKPSSSDEHSNEDRENLSFLLTDFVLSIWSRANEHSELVVEYFAKSSKFHDKSCGDLLYLLMRNHKLQVAKDLLHKIIDDKVPITIVNSEYRYGRVLLHFFAAENEAEIVEYLIQEQKHDCNTKDANSNTPLYCAAENHALKVVQYLLSREEIDPNIRGDEEYTPLHRAIENEYYGNRRNFEVSKALINCESIKINAQDESGRTPLHLASECNILEIVKILVDKGANISIKDRDGKKPIDVASSSILEFLKSKENEYNESLLDNAKKGNLGEIKSLLSRGADVNTQNGHGSTPLHLAAQYGCLDIVQDLVDKGANISIEDRDGKKPIDVASSSILEFLKSKENEYNESLLDNAKKGNLGEIKSLLSRGADVNTQNGHGSTPLHLAAQYGCLDIVQDLVDKGANISIEDRDGKKPIDVASSSILEFLKSKENEYNESLLDNAKKGNLGEIKSLLSRGANIDAKNSNDWALLHLAALYNHLDIVEYLLENDAIVDARDCGKFTPLHLAAENGYAEVVRTLIEGKADINAKNSNGLTPLHLAVDNDHSEIVQILIESSATVGAQDNSESTPLHLAAENGSVRVVNTLVENGANIDAQDIYGPTPLHLAAENGSVRVVNTLVENGANIDAQDIYGSTPLHLAAENGSVRVVNTLVENGANIDAQDIYGSTPLHLAAKNGYAEVVRTLIKGKADINAQDSNESTPLHLAAENGHLEVAQTLVENGANISIRNDSDNTPIEVASSSLSIFLRSKENEYNESLFDNAKKGNLGEIKSLLSRGANVDTQNNYGSTPLHLAAMSGSVGVVNTLVKEGANIDAQDSNESTPLHLAAENGHLEVVQTLVENGANINARNRDKSTPLHLAAENGHLEVVQTLVENGANINARNRDKSTPLHLAAMSGSVGVVNTLVKEGANIDAQDSNESTPLHLAAMSGSVGVVNTLVKEGANIDAQDSNESTPLHLAAENGHLEVVQTLVENVANIDAQDIYRSTPLHLAAENGYAEVVRTLIKGKADINAQDSNESTPLHLAAENGHLEVAQTLVENGANISIRNDPDNTPIEVASSSLSIFLRSKESEYNESLLGNAKKGNLGEIKSLLSRGASVDTQNSYGSTPLHLAAMSGSVGVVNTLVEEGANIDARNHDKSTPLHLAVENGHLEIVNTLVKEDADIDAQDHDKFTPLHLAAMSGIVRIVNTLVKEGANINAQDSNKSTPLHLAARSGSVRIVNTLVKEGANINAQDSNKSTPLHLAARSGSVRIVNTLVKEGANINAQDSNKSTPLHLAARSGSVRIVNTLVKEGANINAQDSNKSTPLHLATMSSSLSIFLRSKENEYNESLLDNAKKGNLGEIKSLLSRGANINTKINYSLFTALHLAAKFNHCELVEFLVKQEGIEINAKNVGGWTPLHLATFFRHPKIIILLLDSGADVTVKSSHQKTPLNLVEELLAKNPEDNNLKAIKDLLFNKLNAQDQQIQSSKKQQKSLLHLSEYMGSHFHDIELKAVEQGLYLPSFEKRGVKIDGKCVAITRGLSQALLLQSNKSFLSNLETSSEIYERIAQGKQISKREEGEVFALSKLLDGFEQHLGSPTNSLPSNLIHTQGYKTFSGLSNYIAGIKSDFAIHLVTSNHVVAIYRTGNNYAYFDSNAAFVSGLKSVDQLMEVVEKGVKSASYKVGEKGFLVEHFNVERANKLLSSGDKQVLTKEIKTERRLLAEQDEVLGFIKVNGQELSRAQLYDFGTKINVEGSVPLLINAGMKLSSKKFQDHLDKEKVNMTAREYLNSLKNSKNVEEVVRATKVIPFIGSRCETEEGEQTRKPKQPLLEQLVKGVVNFIASNLTTAFFASVSQSESYLPEKVDNEPETCLNDLKVDKQLQSSYQAISS